jgi:hypothetical protein
LDTPSTDHRTVTSTVTWADATGGTNTVTQTARLDNWAATMKSWSAATLAGSVNVTGTSDGYKSSTQGDYAYTVINVATTNNFVITDISDPAAPVSHTFSIAGRPTNITVKGDYAYVTNQLDTAELQIIDISDPAAPSVIKSVNMTGSGNGQSAAYVNGYVYVARASDTTTNAFELTIVNVSVPASAVVVGGYNNNISMNGVTVIGTNAFLATSSTSAEMLVVNVAVPAAPVLLATYNPTTPNAAAQTISSYGNTVFLGMSTTLDAIDVTTPNIPTRKDTFTAAGAINDIDPDLMGTEVFLATSSTTGEFQAVNVTTLTAMTLSKTVDVSGTASTLYGITYDRSLDVVVGSSASSTQEIVIFTRG